jgi:glycosyltransferase A (GT-A) superfamily protein (DUF2064 family)
VKPAVALVVAKAPVAGRVKTRLGQVVGMERAAGLAAAALLDTLTACAAAYGVERCHLALDGDLTDARGADALLEGVAGWSVHPQRGDGFAERLVRAHQTVAAASGAPVVQVGMDTPHLAVTTLRSAASLLTAPDQAVLGQAHDGGWWLIGLGGPHLLAHLGDVPMSTSRTGELTRVALERAGATVHETASMRDVDDVADAESVAAEAPDTRFARSWR